MKDKAQRVERKFSSFINNPDIDDHTKLEEIKSTVINIFQESSERNVAPEHINDTSAVDSTHIVDHIGIVGIASVVQDSPVVDFTEDANINGEHHRTEAIGLTNLQTDDIEIHIAVDSDNNEESGV